MDFALSKEHQAFREELLAYLDGLRQSRVIDLDAVSEEYDQDPKALQTKGLAFVRQLGKDGWLGIGVPKKYGGRGLGFVEQWLFLEELKYQSLPTGQLLIQSIIPALVFLASDEIRKRFLPLCMSGDVMFAIGYSEPNAGSDLAALTTRATKTDGGYRINGTKIWTTNAQNATHLWLAARTGAPDSRHKGISLFIMPTDQSGVTIQPIITQADEQTNQVFLDDVFVDEDLRVGDENEGWKFIMAQLNFERLFCISEMLREFHSLLHWWKSHKPADTSAYEFERRELAKVAADIEVCRLMAKRAAWMMDTGRVPEAEASISKVFYSTTHLRASIEGLKLMGPPGQVRFGERDAPAYGRIERGYRATPVYNFGAGANEIQRDIIANRGLDLPRIR